ncbi:MAG: carbon storage regulator, partial [Gammaproteobacteria bacterium]
GQKLIIGDTIKIEVLGMKGRQIRLGITAPKDVRVDREEVHLRIQQETLPDEKNNPPEIIFCQSV